MYIVLEEVEVNGLTYYFTPMLNIGHEIYEEAKTKLKNWRSQI